MGNRKTKKKRWRWRKSQNRLPQRKLMSTQLQAQTGQHPIWSKISLFTCSTFSLVALCQKDKIWKQIKTNACTVFMLKQSCYMSESSWTQWIPRWCWCEFEHCSSNDGVLLSLSIRRSPDSPAEQQTHTYEEADHDTSVETEPPVVESWTPLRSHRSGPSANRWWPPMFDIIPPPQPPQLNPLYFVFVSQC